jgi:hypothetical protein
MAAKIAITRAQRSELPSKIAALRAELRYFEESSRPYTKEDLEGDHPEEFRRFVERAIKEHNDAVEKIKRELAELER